MGGAAGADRGALGGIQGNYNDTFSLPDTGVHHRHESAGQGVPGGERADCRHRLQGARRQHQLAQDQGRGDGATGEGKALPSVATVVLPYIPTAVPARLASKDDTAVGRARVVFKEGGPGRRTQPMSRPLIDDVKAANAAAWRSVSAGRSSTTPIPEPPKTEARGILVAIVIMLIMFGSLLAAGLPILTALIGLRRAVPGRGGGAFHGYRDVRSDVGRHDRPGVGIDYALFVINRYRQAVLVGRGANRWAPRPSTPPVVP